MTQLWRVALPNEQQNTNQLNVDLSVLGIKNLKYELREKRKEAKLWSEIYYKLSDSRKKWYVWIGALAAILAIFAGSSHLADWFGAFGQGLIMVTTLFVGVLTALQTFLDLSRQSEKLETAGKEWGKLARKIDQHIWNISFTETNPEKQFAILTEIIKEMNDVEDFSPTIPIGVYEKAKKEFESQPPIKKEWEID